MGFQRILTCGVALLLLAGCAKDSGSKSSVSELNQRFCSERQAWNSALMLQPGPQPTNEEKAKTLGLIQDAFTGLSSQYQALHEEVLARSMTEIADRMNDYRSITVEPFQPHIIQASFAVEQAFRDTGIRCPTTSTS
jgi:hypothetical protein